MTGIRTMVSARMGQIGMGMAILVLGFAVYRVHVPIVEVALYWWERVGAVMLGLLPLSVFLLYVIGQIVMADDARTQETKRELEMILFAAPLLGMLGTVMGLIEGLQQFYLIEGVENLLDVLTEFLRGASRMMYTTAWGLLIALPAGFVKIWLFSDGQISHETCGSNSTPPEIQPGTWHEGRSLLVEA